MGVDAALIFMPDFAAPVTGSAPKAPLLFLYQEQSIPEMRVFHCSLND
jgi:hypothetical protein